MKRIIITEEQAERLFEIEGKGDPKNLLNGEDTLPASDTKGEVTTNTILPTGNEKEGKKKISKVVTTKDQAAQAQHAWWGWWRRWY